MRIVLDDNVVRHIGEGERTPYGLGKAKARGASVHLADGTLAELSAQILDGRFSFEKWDIARSLLKGIVDPKEPILLGGRQGLARDGVYLPGKTDRVTPEEIGQHLDGSRRAWWVFTNAPSLKELLEVVPLGPAGMNAENDAIKEEWINGHLRARDRAVQEVPEVEELNPGRGDLPEMNEEIFQRIAADIDATRPDAFPKPSVRLDAMIRVYTLKGNRHLRKKEPYNPRRRANDAFDFDLLRYLAYPAVLCTGDEGIFRDLRASESWQLQWVVRPEELENDELLQRLSVLNWPAN